MFYEDDDVMLSIDDDDEVSLNEILYSTEGEEEYLREMQEYVEYMRSIDEEFDRHCRELEEIELEDEEE
jgi:arylsulfatase A-like enzyme